MSHLTIDPQSPAHMQLAKAILAGKRIRIATASGGVQIKIGEGTWTTPLATSTPDEDVRVFHDQRHTNGCGLPDWRDQPDEYDGPTCGCCKHCNVPGGH
jgi:hypothetical protein